MEATKEVTLTKGLLFILSAPAGTGKTSLVNLFLKNASNITLNISYTTRLPRPDEIDGVHYHFVSKDKFHKMVANGDFLEHVHFCGNEYGTSKRWIEAQQAKGKHVLLVIDTQGMLKLKSSKYRFTSIFLTPPSLIEQEKRLKNRNTDSIKDIEKRLAHTTIELEAAKYYNYIIVNDELEKAAYTLQCIVEGETHRYVNMKGHITKLLKQ